MHSGIPAAENDFPNDFSKESVSSLLQRSWYILDIIFNDRVPVFDIENAVFHKQNIQICVQNVHLLHLHEDISEQSSSDVIDCVLA